jgi:branched-chain amino acid transport system substrate-binding protein
MLRARRSAVAPCRPRVRWALAIAFCAALLAACEPAEPVRIGFIGGLSGRVADLGVAGRNGAQLAIETLNAQGRTRYELRVDDDQHDPAKARGAIVALASQNVSFIVGPMTSAMAVAVVPEADRLKLVMISPTANTHELSGKDDYFFRVIADAPTGARQLAEALHQRGIASLAVLMDAKNRSYSESFGRACSERFRERGGRVTAELNFESGANVDLAALSARLLAEQPQAVLLASSAVDAALIAQTLRRLSPNVGLAATPWAATDQLIETGGRGVEGMLVPQAIDRESTAPPYLDFKRRYRERFGEDPGSGAVNAFDAVMMGAEALRRRSASQTLRDVLATTGTAWPGLQHTISLDATGDNATPIFMTEVRGGRFASIR